MDKKDKSLLKSLGVYIDPKLNKKYKHKHSSPEDWVRFYYYKQRKPFIVPRSNIRYDAEVTSTNSLHKHTFYKMSHLSKTDSYYDYYYKLKEDVDECVVKENKRLTKQSKFNKNFKPPPPERDENGKFVVRFE